MLAGLLVLLLLAAFGVGGYLLGHDGTRSGVAGAEGLRPGVPTIVSVSQLENLAAARGPIYWAGVRPGRRFEVTLTTRGGIYVRYLPKGVSAGSKHPYLTVGTYDFVNGYGALIGAKKRDAQVEVTRSGAVIATFHSAPDSTYFAFPTAAFQVEVFSPVAGQSRALTKSGDITLVPSR